MKDKQESNRPWEHGEIDDPWDAYGQWLEWMDEKVACLEHVQEAWEDMPESVKPHIYGIMCDITATRPKPDTGDAPVAIIRKTCVAIAEYNKHREGEWHVTTEIYRKILNAVWETPDVDTTDSDKMLELNQGVIEDMTEQLAAKDKTIAGLEGIIADLDFQSGCSWCEKNIAIVTPTPETK
jgi:hypothetical protein